eukprot:5040938-Pyramimonas_sp.AAC.1
MRRGGPPQPCAPTSRVATQIRDPDQDYPWPWDRRVRLPGQARGRSNMHRSRAEDRRGQDRRVK